MKTLRWLLGALILTGIVALIIFRPLPFLFHHELPRDAFFGRALYILILAAALCLFRVIKGPTAADRIVAVDLIGIMIIGLCAVLTITTGRSWYLDIGIAWSLQSFITVIALSKYLEEKGPND